MADFKNPQQEPGAEKRLLLVFLLTFVVLIIFQMVKKPQAPVTQAPVTRVQKQAMPEQSTPPPSAAVAVEPVRRAGAPAATASKQAAAETETIIESDLYKLSLIHI